MIPKTPETVKLALDYLEAEARRAGDKQKIADAQKLRQLQTHPLNMWRPRPDQLNRFDNQTAVVNDRGHAHRLPLGPISR